MRGHTGQQGHTTAQRAGHEDAGAAASAPRPYAAAAVPSQPMADLADLRDLLPAVEVFTGEWQPSVEVRRSRSREAQLVLALAPVRRNRRPAPPCVCFQTMSMFV